MTFLPHEVLSQILLYLQPENRRKGVQKVHPPRGRPFILVLGQVSRQWRRVVKEHCFWDSLQFYLLVKIPNAHSFGLKDILRISQFLKECIKSYSTSRKIINRIQPEIHLTPALSGHYLIAQDVVSLLNLLKHKEKVLRITLHMNWLTLGNRKLIGKLCEFAVNCKELTLKGEQEEDVLFGLDNHAIRLMANHFTKLELLYIQGYGGGSFTFKSFFKLLKSNPSLKSLEINKIRGLISLKKIASSCPNLESLSLRFSEEEKEGEVISLEDPEIFVRNTVQGTPLEFQGNDLTCFHKLRRIKFTDSSTSQNNAMVMNWNTPVIIEMLHSLGIDKDAYSSGKWIDIPSHRL